MTAPRQYKDFTPRMGIYRVSHLPSGRTLLGHSLHLEGMLNRIRFQLQNGLHPDKAMQADWKADGPDAFSFEVLDEITPKNPGDEPVDDLKELLTLWQEKLNLPPAQLYSRRG
ncbi:GIY-YIG nuclease family protein [Deinococcus radiopugnans]|uniref:GIY-YIG nuclease family protein n=1 Tax=Deinococcus radiopugnans ATCC 19172 TaxID=585398 RepID=A0A5C4XZ37_9DEIO|nr:GIY-YIG nuclease family protein [Deinococcus radiopugnans]MBB6018095.1 hypothetical protein [Deinococcus radiopugnans ATCC 19172]TNM68390.1 GIY-YIG nuclease family protein [Deinococcus radiopugnans ATCC 19172]